MRTFQIYFSITSKHTLILLSLVAWNTSHNIYCIAGSLYVLTPSPVYPMPQTTYHEATTTLFSVSMNLVSFFHLLCFLDSACKSNHMVFVFLRLTYFTCIISSRFMHVSTNSNISFFIMAEYTCHTHLLYTFTHRWKLRLCPYLDYCK